MNPIGSDTGKHNTDANIKKIQANLLAIARNFVLEVKSERVANSVTLDAHLERDLGIDSLGRVELFLRIERSFEESLPDGLIAEAETLADIAKAIEIVYSSGQKIVKPLKTQDFVYAPKESPHVEPGKANSLLEVLQNYAAADANRPHLYLIPESAGTGEEKIIRYGELLESAKKIAAGLLSYGLKPRETVAIMLPTGEEFFYSFFGIMLAGCIPVPIYPPFRADKIEEYAVREAKILNNAEIKILITFSQAEALSKLLRVFIPSLKAVVQVSDLIKRSKGEHVPNPSLESDYPAMIQYTSGSTSDPKGVLLNHSNLLGNIRSVGSAVGMSSRDVGVSWLPLYHDMGLIGAWFCSLYHGFPLTVMSPLTFLSHPERWLWAIHYHRGTLSAGPNFAYELCVRRIRDQDIEGLDLSSWRLAFNGAENINPKTIERFIEKFSAYGFKPEACFPVYGLAESTVALTVPPVDRGPKIDKIERRAFETEQQAVAVASEQTTLNSREILEFVACGSPIPDHEIRIVDENDQEVAERKVGTLQFTGPSAMQGYYHNPKLTQEIYHDGWWDSGDFAYVADGDVYITGRKKDLIIKAGRNIYPQELEEVTAQVTGIRKGCVVAFGVADPKSGTEKLIVIAETAESNPKIRDQLMSEVTDKISVVLGMPPDQVILVPPRSIPKTSSGKLQRSACKSLYLQGKLSKRGLPAWLQVGKLFLKGIGLSIATFMKKIGRLIYTTYILALALLILPLIWLCVSIFPKRLSIKIAHGLVYVFLLFSFCRFKITGRENLKKAKSMVFVANHASYIDSVILFILLPENSVFVGKKELRRWPIVSKIFRKFNFLTVDRVDFAKNIADTEIIVEALKEGHSIVIYPEGTFTYATGLRPFKMGAFKVAVETGTPLCPIALNGTRGFMRDKSYLFSPSKIIVTINEPIWPEKQEWAEVTRLHAIARKKIAENCGELMIDMVVAGPQ